MELAYKCTMDPVKRAELSALYLQAFPKGKLPIRPLVLLNSNEQCGYGYCTISGRVKNISEHALSNIEVVGRWSDKNSTYEVTNDAMLEFNPLLPGQSSSFRVMHTDNPQLRWYRVNFKEFSGEEVDYEDLTNPKKETKEERAKKDKYLSLFRDYMVCRKKFNDQEVTNRKNSPEESDWSCKLPDLRVLTAGH